MALAAMALFASGAVIATVTIVTTIAPHHARIARLLRDGPEWTVAP